MSETERYELHKLLRQHAAAAHQGEAFKAGQIAGDIMSFVHDLQSFSHPDTGDTAALDDLLDDWNSAHIAFGQWCSWTNEQRVNKARAAIHERLAALVQAEREACLKIVEQDYSFTVNEQNTRNRIARAIRERSHA